MTNSNIPATLEALVVPIDGLRHFGKNPRKGDVDAIADSLTRHGQYRPIVVRSGSNEVLAGNHTLKAARDKLGWSEIAATFVDVDDDQAARIVLVDNRVNDVATYDESALVEMLQSLPDLDGTGFGPDDLEALLGVPEGREPSDDVDELPEPPDPIAKLGDLFVLGRHRVVCGDSTDRLTVGRVLEGKLADCMWTDPPYGVDYVGKTNESLTVMNDGADDLEKLLEGAFGVAVEHLRGGAPVYVAHADATRSVFEGQMTAAGFLFRQELIWVKSSLVLGRSDYHYKHEPILYGFAPGGAGRLGRGGARWYGDDSQVTTFEVEKPPANREHPTMKPVALILAMLSNSLKRGGVVFDPFGGSGSTLLAAEFHGSDARLVELNPRYIDVICARYQKETGVLPTLNGKPVNFLNGGDDGSDS